MPLSRLAPAFLSIVFAAGAFPASVNATQPPQISAQSYILVDGASHRVLLEKNADERLQPASLSKMMTAYVALDALKRGSIRWEQDVRVEAEDVAQVAGDEAAMHLHAGQVVRVQDLVNGLIVASANEAAMVLPPGISFNFRFA